MGPGLLRRPEASCTWSLLMAEGDTGTPPFPPEPPPGLLIPELCEPFAVVARGSLGTAFGGVNVNEPALAPLRSMKVP